MSNEIITFYTSGEGLPIYVILQAFNKNITSLDPLPFEGVTYGAFLAKDTFSAKFV